MQSHPNALLTLPPKLGGLGIPDFCELVQKEKIGILHRAKHADPGTRHAAEAIVIRAAELCNRHPSPHQKVQIRQSPSHKTSAPYWIDSLLQYYGSAGLSLTLGGTSNNLQDTSIEEAYRAQNISLSNETIWKLQDYGISNLGDLLHVNTNHDLTNSDDPYTIGICPRIQALLPSNGSHIAGYIDGRHVTEHFTRVGTCWEYRDDLDQRTHVAEILGIPAPGQYAVRLWIQERSHLSLHPKSIIRGNGSTCTIKHHNIFSAEFARKYIISPDIRTPTGNTIRKTVACFLVNSPSDP